MKSARFKELYLVGADLIYIFKKMKKKMVLYCDELLLAGLPIILMV